MRQQDVISLITRLKNKKIVDLHFMKDSQGELALEMIEVESENGNILVHFPIHNFADELIMMKRLK